MIKTITVFVMIAVLLSATTLSRAAESVVLEESFTKVNNGWAKVERYRDTNTDFPVEDYPPDGRGDQDGQRLTYFGDKRPQASRFLLYYAPGWDSNSKSVPILLVHGANDSADRSWANPNELGFGCGSAPCPNTGLMQYLSGKGYKVFAINFAHKQGDNYIWAQQIHNAVTRIQKLTGAKSVDIIAISKGAFAAHMYVSGLKQKWGAGYGGGVRKLFLVGSPNLGIDFAFRHGAIFNPVIFPACGLPVKVNGPSPHTAILCQGKWQTFPEFSIYTTSAGNFFPGQKQMLMRWDERYPLPQNDPDWQTTYFGGKGAISEGLGIKAAMEQGSIVPQLRKAGIPGSITTYLIAGAAANIPLFHNEHSGPSDGLLFVESATNTEGIANVGGVKVVEEANHLQLAWHTKVLEQINSWLEK